MINVLVVSFGGSIDKALKSQSLLKGNASRIGAHYSKNGENLPLPDKSDFAICLSTLRCVNRNSCTRQHHSKMENKPENVPVLWKAGKDPIKTEKARDKRCPENHVTAANKGIISVGKPKR